MKARQQNSIESLVKKASPDKLARLLALAQKPEEASLAYEPDMPYLRRVSENPENHILSETDILVARRFLYFSSQL